MKIETWLKSATLQLQSADCSTPRLDAQILACDTINCSKAWLLSHPEHVINPGTVKKMNRYLKQRVNHIPIAYILGIKEFYGREFKLNRDVLVPRPESEALIALALQITQPNLKVIDVGCGSGILGITLALEKPDWNITLSDISPEAIQIARQNTILHQISSRVEFALQDLMREDRNDYDLAICNLPYVPDAMRHKIDLIAEPAIALYSGAEGLDHYTDLFSLLSQRTAKPRFVITESLESQHTLLSKLARESGYGLIQTADLAQLYRPVAN